ncbi:hypothetical protein INT45_010556 [Circinella minor]|uniref:Uncharacterized protein n=1 Tax=Circinella minor TaxID=1195481 RepID=A0A8H7S9D4_9FUNG|nr:hypothetical protein INT45_010556 [Circinella minor]
MTETSIDKRIKDAMATEISQNSPASELTMDYKALWIKNIQDCAYELGLQMDSVKPSWRRFKNKPKSQDNTSPAESTSRLSPSSEISTPSSSSLQSSSRPTLKTPLEVGDRERIVKLYEELNPESCCPALSFILDTCNPNWEDYFNKEELEELRNSGKPVLRPIPVGLVSKFNEVEKLKGVLEAYDYGHQIKHHPINDPLLAWLSQALMQTSKFFIPGSSTPIQRFLESDSLYYLWFPVNTIFHNSNIQALRKEKTSNSHANLLNKKRKLSSSLEIEREKIGRRIDTIYIGSDIELGGLEIGARRDNTKEFQDSMLKLPLVLKDMLTEIINHRPSLLRDAHVLGYNINGIYTQ